jgi:hypothetical protein
MEVGMSLLSSATVLRLVDSMAILLGRTTMGADLICYIALGPTRIDLDESKKTTIAAQVRQYLDACVVAAEQALLGKDEVPDPRPAPVEARRSVTFCLGPPAWQDCHFSWRGRSRRGSRWARPRILRSPQPRLEAPAGDILSASGPAGAARRQLKRKKA